MYGKFKNKNISVTSKAPTKLTLDATHRARIKYFQEQNQSLPLKYRQLNGLKRKLEKLKKEVPTDLEKYILEKGDLRTEICTLERRISEIEENKDELDYYLNAGPILFEYYENINQKPDHLKELNQRQPEKKSVVDFFSKNSTNNTVVTPTPTPTPTEIKTPPTPPEPTSPKPKSKSVSPLRLVRTQGKKGGNWRDFFKQTDQFQRADLYDEFLTRIDPHYIKSNTTEENQDDYYCQKCQEYRLFNQGDSYMVCAKCGECVPLIIESDKPNYKDVPIEISYFAYKRMNHFNECLSQFQAKESTEIPQAVYDTILLEMKKERNTNLASLTRARVKQYLKKHSNKKFNKYYEHIPHIINRLNGIQPKTMTPRMEEELRIMFRQIQAPFDKHCPEDRKNFLNYNYVLHKFCQLKGWDEFLSCFPLLKSKDKLYQQDKIWRNICADLKWMYIPSR